MAASTWTKEFNGNGGNKDAARKVGELVAKRAVERVLTEVVFDRGGYIFHGRVKELAERRPRGRLEVLRRRDTFAED